MRFYFSAYFSVLVFGTFILGLNGRHKARSLLLKIEEDGAKSGFKSNAWKEKDQNTNEFSERQLQAESDKTPESKVQKTVQEVRPFFQPGDQAEGILDVAQKPFFKALENQNEAGKISCQAHKSPHKEQGKNKVQKRFSRRYVIKMEEGKVKKERVIMKKPRSPNQRLSTRAASKTENKQQGTVKEAKAPKNQTQGSPNKVVCQKKKPGLWTDLIRALSSCSGGRKERLKNSWKQLDLQCKKCGTNQRCKSSVKKRAVGLCKRTPKRKTTTTEVKTNAYAMHPLPPEQRAGIRPGPYETYDYGGGPAHYPGIGQYNFSPRRHHVPPPPPPRRTGGSSCCCCFYEGDGDPGCFDGCCDGCDDCCDCSDCCCDSEFWAGLCGCFCGMLFNCDDPQLDF